MIKWFAAIKLVLNLDKSEFNEIYNKWSHSTFHTGYKEKYKEETVNTKFLGLQIDTYLNWKKVLKKMIPNGSMSSFRPMVHISNINTVKSIYYTYFYAIIKRGTISVVTLGIVGRFSLHKGKLSKLWLVYNTEPNADV